ncbi:LIC12015 family putative lipoprotein, partial [Leptospira santarosai]|uniref:LIC12015 family putative lipoprotein n=1 Tax=Leptospira santarosai TaxID=28183 RepID=UPI004036115D
MKQKILSLTILSLLVTFATNCSRDSDVLASFKSGTVTREELRTYYKLRGIEPDLNSASIATQAKIVEEIGIQKITEINNKNTNIVTKDEYDKIMSFVEPQVVFNDYRKQFSEKLLTSGMLEFAFGRILFLKAGPDTSAKANTFLQQIQTIKSDREIAEFITKNTDEAQRKAIGGKLEPHCINCGDDPFTAILKEATDKKGEFILKEAQGNYYILRVERIEKIYPKKIDKFFQNELDKLKTLALKYVSKEGITEDEKNAAKFYSDVVVNERANQTAEHYGNRFFKEAWKKEMDSLKAKSGLKIADLTPEFIKGLKSETVLFEDKNGTKFSFKDLIAEFNKISTIIQKRKGSLEEEKNDQLSFYTQIYLPI